MIYLFFASPPPPYNTASFCGTYLQKSFQVLSFAFDPHVCLVNPIQSSSDALLLPATQGDLSLAPVYLLMLLSSSHVSPISMLLVLSWAFIPPDHFSLHPSFLSKPFLSPPPSGSWSFCPTSFSFSSHPCGLGMPVSCLPLSHLHLNQKFLWPRVPRMDGELGACLEQAHRK